MKSRDMLIAEAVRDACIFGERIDVVLRMNALDLPAIIASVPGDEPVAYVGGGKTFQDLNWLDNAPQLENGTLLYTSPQQPDPDTRRKAIEECAQVCDAWSERFGYGHWGQEIRALLNKSEGGTK